METDILLIIPILGTICCVLMIILILLRYYCFPIYFWRKDKDEKINWDFGFGINPGMGDRMKGGKNGNKRRI